MKNLLLSLTLIALLTSCSKDKSSHVKPSASFSFSYNTADVFRLGTTDTTMLISSTTNATTVNWDLGDGRKSSDKQLVLSYPKSGTYTVTLTASSGDGQNISVSKKVTVLDRVLKSIVINKVYWNNTDPLFAKAGWPLTNSADVYIKIQQLQGNEVFKNGFVLNAPVIYTSPVLANVSSSNDAPLNINVSPKIVLDKALLLKDKYVISLIAKNSTGEYVLFSNMYSGSQLLIKADDLSKNNFVVRTSFFSSVDLNFDFE